MTGYQSQDLFLWSDEALLAINKPAGLASLPDGYDPHLPHLRAILEPDFGPLWVVHRLDLDASGVMIFARSALVHRELNAMFAERRVNKIYHALVAGEPDWREMEIHLPLLPDGDRKHRTIVDHRRGKHALTEIFVLERFRRYSLIEARPRTGRRHQIRVHLASIGHPLVSDTLYGSGSGVYLSEMKTNYRPGKTQERPLMDRLGLHARSLTFEHPFIRESICVEAPYQKDFQIVLKQCRKYAYKP